MAAYPNRNKPKGSKGKIVLCNNFKTFIHGKTYHYIAIIQAFDQLWAFVNTISREGKNNSFSNYSFISGFLWLFLTGQTKAFVSF